MSNLLATHWDDILFEFVLEFLSGTENNLDQKLYFEAEGVLDELCFSDTELYFLTLLEDEDQLGTVKSYLCGAVEERCRFAEAGLGDSQKQVVSGFKAFFALEDLQFDVFALFVLCQESLHWRFLENLGPADFARYAAPALQLSPERYHYEVLSPAAQLHRCWLFRREGGRHVFLAEDSISVNAEARRALVYETLDNLGMEGTEPVKAVSFPLESFPLTALDEALLQSVLSRKTEGRVLFYGAPGAGKSSLACSLSWELGIPARVYSPVRAWEGDLPFLGLAARAQNLKGGFLIVDEADELLNTQSGLYRSRLDKGEVNRFLESLSGKVIFAANRVDRMDPSTARRFDLILRFEVPTQKRLVEMWTSEITQQGMRDAWSEEQIRATARKYSTNFGVVSQTSRLVKDLPERVREKFSPQAVVESVLASHEALRGTKSAGSEGMEAKLYDVEVLNTSIAAGEVVTATKNWLASGDQVYGLKLLFHGITGGGKTQLARHLARELGLPLVMKKASDLLGSYVGETERGIRAAFDEADRDGALLVLDEADSLLSSRAGAKQRWETSMVNEFLTNIEGHRGIIVVITNLVGALDSALLRRFPLKVEFRPLAPEGRQKLLQHYFPEVASAEVGPRPLDWWGDLTPGDFGTVKARQKLFPHLDVLAALREEAQTRARLSPRPKRIGFSPLEAP